MVGLAVLLWGYAVVEANRHLGQVLLQEAQALADHLREPGGGDLPRVRRTRRPESFLPLMGEGAQTLGLQGGRLRAVASVPLGGEALEVERTAPLFLPSWWPALAMVLGTSLWALQRLRGEVRRGLGLDLDGARRTLDILGAALEALDEGVLVLEGEAVVRFNARALQLLNLPEGALPPLPLVRVWPGLKEIARKGRGEMDLSLPNRKPARVRILEAGRYQVVVVQDLGRLLRLAESLTQSRRHLDLLRAQAHEFRNLLHVIGGLLELGKSEEALRLVRGEVAAENHLENLLSRLELPMVAALVLGKLRRAHELGVRLEVEGSLPASYAPLSEVLTLVLGQLLENALEAVQGLPEAHVLLAFREMSGLWVEVRDNGPGVPQFLENSLFSLGVSAKGSHRGYGLALARSQVEAYGGRLGYYKEGGFTVFYAHIPRAS